MTGDLGAASELAFDSVAELAARLEARELSGVELVEATLARIAAVDLGEDGVRSTVSLDSEATEIAARLDAERAAGRVRGPLHGIPVVVKDNVETAGELGTTAGSLALAGVPVQRDADVVARLRAAGAVVIAKANLSEWANFRSRHSSSGWSAVGGQTRNPYALDRSPGGSSSGSAAAVAAGLVPVAVGTETDGSIVCPAAMNGVVGLKPTHSLVSVAGVVPLAGSQDCVGPLGRSVADAAALLTVLAGPRPATVGAQPLPDYVSSVSADGLAGARIGVARDHYTGCHPAADRLFEHALDAAREAGATLVDPADVPTAAELAGFADELLVLMHELHDGLDRYLAARDGGRGSCPRSLAELVAFNDANAAAELSLFGQDILVESAATGGLDSPDYLSAFARNRERARARGLDPAFEESGADAIVTLTMGPAWCIDQVNGDPSVPTSSSPAAVAGYPALSMPIGTVSGLPVGVTFVGRPWSESTLIRLASGLEHILQLQLRPSFVGSLPVG
ncbi:MAG: amidase [Acidimicrobiaceae bacterium]|nr:amidase [Acidimicrobiaceae bacterium]